MNIEASHNPELGELSRDVAPEKVLDRMEQFEHQIAGSAGSLNRPR